MLSGHTHGGQISPFGLLVMLDQPYLEGLHEFMPGKQIFVSRGTGYWGPPMRVLAPSDPSQRVAFMSIVENIAVDPGAGPAKIIVNSRTGTVVIGSNVRVTAAAVTHGSLTVTISNNPIVSQPEPLSGGETVVVPKKDIEVEEEQNRMFLFDPGVSLDTIVEAVNNVGAAPGDLVAILEALKQAGALRAELIII